MELEWRLMNFLWMEMLWRMMILHVFELRRRGGDSDGRRVMVAAMQSFVKGGLLVVENWCGGK